MLTKSERQIVENYLYKLIKETLNESEGSSSHRLTAKEKKSIIEWLHTSEVNEAAIMRRLWNPKTNDEEDAKRSLFSKMVRHEKNDNGSVYDFSDEDYNKLYDIRASFIQ